MSQHQSKPLPALFACEVRAIHCVGVGGMGLGPLAIYLARLGFSVSGEDDAMTDAMQVHLTMAGVTLTRAGAIPPQCELVACSTAISRKHPAFLAATGRNLKIVRRGELLAEVVREKKLAAVCGSHGKTTTTAMLVIALRNAGFRAGYVLGGLFNDPSCPPADIGENEWVVAEIDESDGTIENFSPEITIATNLDWDHPEHYRDPAAIEAAFTALFSRTRQAVLSSIRAKHASSYVFGTSEEADYRYTVVQHSGEGQTLSLSNRFPISQAQVRALGEFNAANATAALATVHLMGAKLADRLLADYPGVRRRQTVLHATTELTVIEDYAHHPAEVRALLSSLRARLPAPSEDKTPRLLVVFQPHRYSRTAQFKTEFADALTSADKAYLVDVYPAGEAPITGGLTADLYAVLRERAPSLPVAYGNGKTDVTLATLARDVRPGDWVAFVGAGDIDHRAREWLALATEYQKVASYWSTLGVALRGSVSTAAKVRIEEPLASKTTMRVGGAARVYAEPANESDLRALLTEARARAVKVLMLGRGSNLLVPDEGVDALVISLGQPAWQTFEIRADGRVNVGAGLRLKNLCGLAAKAGLAGFEFLEGIPGNLGGALRMNAGAMGGAMFDVVEEVRFMTRDGQVHTLGRDQMQVTYRQCGVLVDAIALSAVLRPVSATAAEEINTRIEAYRTKRQASQPRESSAGCIFKNPEGNSAGRLIDECGLKGMKVGGAEVSAAHANFIINRGDATATDVIELARRVRDRVAEAKGVRLVPEVMLFGKEWSEVL